MVRNVRLVHLKSLVEGPPGHAPCVQPNIACGAGAGSTTLLDASPVNLGEKFANADLSGDFVGNANELVESGGRTQDDSSDQQPWASAQPSIKEPTSDQSRDDRGKQCKGSGIGHPCLAINLFFVFFVDQDSSRYSH